jgi:phenylalanyl-tRNA synthetase beta chain
MKVPINWLKDYVDINVDTKELGDRLTLTGSMAEEIISKGADISNVVTGKIVQLEKHPDADKLFVCQVDIGAGEPIQIITAATNMKLHDTIPVALHNSTLHGGMKIKKTKMRGLVSNGMFCSEEELGLAEEQVHGLMILPEGTPLGKDIKEVLGLSSEIIDFELTSNRPDCMSIIGMARETAATLNTKYRMPDLSYTVNGTGNVNDILKVEIKDTLCRRFVARGVKNVKIGPSPKWMQDKLTEAGVRPISNIVDITNFVMLEFGQPMHAYDVREISTNRIVVERAKTGDKFTTLDGTERDLNENMLTIKDGETTIGLAGIMGGLNSEIKEDTTGVIFESANFEPINIRVSTAKLGLRTEASTRFEKGLDPNMSEQAIDRACQLVIELGAGEVMEGTVDVYPERVVPKVMEVDSRWINSFLGTDMPKEDMKEYLGRLDMETVISGDDLIITVPTFRVDVSIKEDISEEVARIFGYENIPMTIIESVNTRGGKTLKQKFNDKTVEALICCGLNQSISYTFVSPKCFDKIGLPESDPLRKAVVIKNPLGEDYSIMRTSSIPSTMEALTRNFTKSNPIARLFEVGKIYIPGEDLNQLPEEKNIAAVGMYGGVDFFNIKGVVENLMESLGISRYEFKRESGNPSFHPGKTAALYVKGEYAGVLGEIHPDVNDSYDISERCYVAELSLDIIYKHAELGRAYKAIPKFPAVLRDLAMLVDDSVMVKEIEDIIIANGAGMVESVKLFDVYKGKQIPEGKKSVAYSIAYRLDYKTLTDEEVSQVHEKIVKNLETALGAELR